MVQYVFLFNDEGEFVCQRHIGDSYSEIVGGKAISKLKDIDKIKYKNVNATKKQVKLKSDNTETIILNLNEFYKHNYTKYLPKSMRKIKRAIEKYQKAKYKGKKVTPLKVACNGIVYASVVSMLIASASNLKNISKNVNDNKPKEFKKIESNIVKKPVDIEIENVITDKIDDLIDELEQEDNNEFQEDNYGNLQESSSVNLEDNDSVNLEDNQQYESSINNYINNDQLNVAYLRFDDLTDSITYTGAYDKVYDIVEYYANKWGFTPNLEMAIVTQESAGKLENLTEIEFGAWEGQKIKAYDFINNRYQRIVFSNNVQKYANTDIMVITEEDLKNPKTNISVSCILIRYCLERMRYNIPAAIQMYNMGEGNMQKILAETSKNTGMTVDELLSDKDNVDFLDYTYVVGCGDPEYLNNISRYLSDEGEIRIKVLNDEGKVEELVLLIRQKTL